MQVQTQAIGFGLTLEMDYEVALNEVIEALKAEGFGVLTEIDVKETLKNKLDVDFRRYKILGACNPPLAYKALTTQSSVGLLLPCNVTVSETDDGKTEVMFLDPMRMMEMAGNPDLAAVASEARERLDRVATALEEM